MRRDVKRRFCLVMEANLIFPNTNIHHSLPFGDSVLVMVCNLVIRFFLYGECFRKLTLLLRFDPLSFLSFGLVLWVLDVVVFKLELLFWTRTTLWCRLFQLLILEWPRLGRTLFWKLHGPARLVLTHRWLNKEWVVIAAWWRSSQVAVKWGLPAHYGVLHETQASTVWFVRLN